MLQVEDALKELYKADSTDKNLILDFYRSGQAEPFLRIWEPSKILFESMEIDESLSSSKNLDFGSCEASQMKITLIGVEDEIKGAEMDVYQTLEGQCPSDNLMPGADLYPSGYIMPLGCYIVQSAERQGKNRAYRDVIALDFMRVFDVDVIGWYNALPFPITLREFRSRLCSHVGVCEHVPDYLPNDSMLVEKTIDAAQLMGRDVLVACEQINGVFGHFDRNGTLQHIALQPNYALVPAQDLYPTMDLYPALPGEMNEQVYDERISRNLYRTCQFEEYTVKSIDNVQIRQEEGDIGASYGTGDNTLTVEGNFLVYGKSAYDLNYIVMGIHGMVSGRKYIPYDCSTKGLPYVEVGDTELIEADQGNIISYVIKRTLKGIYALKDTHSATGEETRGTENNINTEIIQLKGKAAILKRNVDEVSANLIDLEKRTESKFVITAEQISAEVKRAQEAESFLSVHADKIATSVKDLQRNVESQITQMADSIALKVGNDQLIASINLELNKMGSVITMNAGHFEFKGQNFFVNLDGSGGAANGNITWDEKGNLTLKGATISGGVISNISSASTISCNTLGVVYADVDRGSWDRLSFGSAEGNDLSCGRIDCPEINTFSDRRLKKNIRKIDSSSASALLSEIHPVSFEMKKDGRDSMGFIAQDVRNVCERHNIKLPLYSEREDGYLAINYINYIPLIVAALQDLQGEIEGLKRK